MTDMTKKESLSTGVRTLLKNSMLAPYFQLARLHKFPAGVMVGFWPSAWAVTMASFSLHLPVGQLAQLLVIFFFGSTLAHSASCTFNDICDVDFDRQVERTKNRPLASGQICMPAAWMFCLLQVALCVGMLTLANDVGFWLGLFGLFPLHALYPLMKRVTYWPQAWLGLGMNWGMILGWVILVDDVDWTLLAILLSGCVCWTIVYDTIYGCQDKADDAKAGVKSTALLFGSSVKPILAAFSAIFVGTLVMAGLRNQQGPAFFAVSVAGAVAHLTWQLVTLDVENSSDCWRKFLANGDLGCIVWLGMALDYATEVPLRDATPLPWI